MKAPFLWIGVATAALALGGCQKKAETPAGTAATAPAEAARPKPATVELVKEAERSASFAAVNRHLELGGTLYGYVDIDGDVVKLLGTVQGIAREVSRAQPGAAMLAQQDLPALGALLGLTDVKAIGFSSVPDGSGFFRNNAFLYTGGERHGLMAALGGKPGPFKHLAMAPADTSFYTESELDLGVIYKTLKEVATKVGGEKAGNELENALKKAGEAATFSILDLIHGFKGHSSVVLRVDSTKTMRTPGPQGVTLPSFALLVTVEGIGGVVEPSLTEAQRVFRRTEMGTAHVYEPTQPMPLPELKPAFIIDGSTLYFTTSLPFFGECRAQKSGLAQVPEFQQALARVGQEGNGLTYVSPKVFGDLKKILELNPQLPPEPKSVLGFVLNSLPATDRPLIALRVNTDDGVLFRSYMNRSLKQDVAGVAVYNPVSVGLLAAMAIPAFQKVRSSSQEKAILNNLRQLAAAADQYYLENGVSSATYDDLVGARKYIKVINPVAGENYRALRFQQGSTLRVRTAAGRTVEYRP